MDKRSTALFYIAELKYDGAKRKDILETLVGEMMMTKANATYYLDRVAK